MRVITALLCQPGRLRAKHSAFTRSRREIFPIAVGTAFRVAVDGTLAGLIGVADPIKDTTPDAIAQLHPEGVRVVMLTGGIFAGSFARVASVV